MNSTARTRAPRGAWLLLLVGAIVGALLGLLVPGPPAPAPQRGDPALATELVAALDGAAGFSTVSAVRLRDGEASWAGLGEVSLDSRYELGSITKTFNGLLLADAVERGELRLDDRLDSLLVELVGSPAGAITLEELASHRSGLPAMGEIDQLQVAIEDLAGRALTVYAEATLDDLIAAARASELPTRGEMAYSNLGAALLGHALARGTGADDWATLVEERLLEPLGMHGTRIDADVPAPDLLPPHQANGRPTEPWTGSGYGPAGVGVTTTAADLVRYAEAILDGTAPGLDALEPRWPAMLDQRIGLGWMVSGTVSWHNGGTGGMRTMLAIDREAGTAAIVLASTAIDVTGAGLALLGAPPEQLPPQPPFDFDTVGWVAAGLLAAAAFAWGAVRSRSRARLVGQALAATGGLAIWAIAAPWDWAPPWLLGLAVGLVVAAVAVALGRWRELPWWPPRRRPAAIVVAVAGALWFAATVAVSVAVLALILG